MLYQWVEDRAGLEVLCEAVAQTREPLFVDTEFMRERTYWPRLALIQINTGSQGFLVDAPALAGQAALLELFAGRTLVMHACSEDLEALRAFGCMLPVAVEDTQVAAALCGYSLQASYQKLVAELLGVELPKDVTRSDWLQRPLGEKQRTYAEQDVVHLPALRELLTARLKALERMDWWREECTRLRADVLHEPSLEDCWRQVKGAGRLRGPALVRLSRLAAWREQTARARDLPRGFVIRDQQMLALAEQGARSEADLRRLELHPALLRRDGSRLLELVRDSGGETQPEPLPDTPGPRERTQLKELRGRVKELARELELEPEVLARRRWLEALVRCPDTLPEPLSGWRRERVAGPLRELLGGYHDA